MIDQRTKKFLMGTVREYCSPDQIHATLANFQGQVEEAQGRKKLVLEAFILGIKRVLGKV